MNQHQSQRQSSAYPIGMTRRVMNARTALTTWFENIVFLIIALILTVTGGILWFAHDLELRLTGWQGSWQGSWRILSRAKSHR